ncbi:DNA (cytosine-5-)-methyltransferase [Aliivibrio fischeri]|uniref:DNA (cytosine-5-)-methyltransferase n=1 Tax=Aliivibrio fischeri TaxID=668 RepID=UPI00080E41FE|nr:DNA (cytosine-5-)-methyltransferase [Aliivibrio fischeri]OCH32022.1 DNA (cytosine-5-)-methyltransferase [Aliivibrio fischeri]
MKFIDLFAGMGGTRIGFEQACEEKGIQATCVFTSEIKDYAKSIYEHNFNDEVSGDITSIEAQDIPDFDFLLGGFPCQAFSSAGKRHGFEDSRGTLFFHIARILKEKKPKGFLLENVPGLVTHQKKTPGKEIGETLETILDILEELGYQVSWAVLDSSEFGIAQKRKRIYITGHLDFKPNLSNFNLSKSKLGDILEKDKPCEDTPFRRKLLSLYKRHDLYGKSIKDKRGGPTNIHSWDLELKGSVSQEQKTLMGMLLKQRRQKKWALEIGIVWMDGMPLTLDQIATFYRSVSKDTLKIMLDDLVDKNYIKFEHPRELIILDNGTTKREPDTSKPKGYNIVTGKLSFELNKILDPKCISNTIVATETSKLGVLDTDGIRTLTDRECLRLFGFPDNYKVNIKQKDLYDLIGNTVVVPVIKEVAKKII